MPLPSLAPEGFKRIWDAYPKKPAVPATPVDFEQSELGLAISAYSRLIESGWTDERAYRAMELYKEAILRRNGATSWTEIGVTYLKTLKNALTDANLSPFAPMGTWEADAALHDKQASDARFANLKSLRRAVNAHLDGLSANEGAARICRFWTERAGDTDDIAHAASGLLDTYRAGYAITQLPTWARISHITKYDKKVNAEFCMWYAERYLQTEEKAA